ncbi:MAG: F0F1 ATP synthase subunit delta [candidate division Zixibacteria bacterium]|nr:F0F1 ATP synthase subunit delta [candidate division Zixibacteria bacterium]
MIAQQVAQKYARALFMAAKGRNLIDKAYDQFEVLRQVIRKDRALLDFLTAPHVTDQQKLELVNKVFGTRLEKLFLEFLLVLMDKHRVQHLPDIIDAFERLVETEKGIVRASVVTAIPLSGDEERNVTARLESRTGKKVKLEKKVDPAILGGMIVIIDDEIIDGSVRHGLKQMREQLGKVKVA